MDEAEIQTGILKAFRARGIFHRRMKLGKVRGSAAVNPMKGFPDIWGFLGHTGQMFVCEVKKPGGKLSPEQVDWRVIFNNRAVPYILAYSVEDAVQGYEAALLTKDFPR